MHHSYYFTVLLNLLCNCSAWFCPSQITIATSTATYIRPRRICRPRVRRTTDRRCLHRQDPGLGRAQLKTACRISCKSSLFAASNSLATWEGLSATTPWTNFLWWSRSTTCSVARRVARSLTPTDIDWNSPSSHPLLLSSSLGPTLGPNQKSRLFQRPLPNCLKQSMADDSLRLDASSRMRSLDNMIGPRQYLGRGGPHGRAA